MNLYENAATQAIATFFHKEPVWKKEIVFNFLLKPFNLSLADIADVTTQDHLQGTIPDFTITTNQGKKIHFEVKIKDVGLTDSETNEDNRDAFLVRKDYIYKSDIPAKAKILYWEQLFEAIDKKEAGNEFARLALVREYMHDAEHTNLLTPHEVAMIYSPETVAAVYTMSEKILDLCNKFVNNPLYATTYALRRTQQNSLGIGWYFDETTGKQRSFFVGICPTNPAKYCFAVALLLKENITKPDGDWYSGDEGWVYAPLDREMLAKHTSDEALQKEFNESVLAILETLK